MILTAAQRSSIGRGSTSLVFAYDEGRPVEGACCVVLAWSEQRRIADQLGNVTVVPPHPVYWIEVTSVKRHVKGGWKVSFDVKDQREHPHFLAWGNGYTTSRYRAVDDLEAVPTQFQDKLAKDAEGKWEKQRLELAIASRQQWRRSRRDAQREMRHVPSRFPAAA